MRIHKISQRRTPRGSFYIARPRNKVYRGPMPPEAQHIPSIRRIYDRSMGSLPPELTGSTPEELEQKMRRKNYRESDVEIYWVPSFNRPRVRLQWDVWRRALRENLENPFERPE